MTNWEEGGVEVTSQAVTFGKPGDFIKGTYTGKKLVHANDRDTMLYEVKGALGEYHLVDGKKNPIEPAVLVSAGEYYNIWGGKDAIDSLFAKSKFGDIIAVQFKEEQPSKVKGHAPFKVYKTLQFGSDPEYAGENSNAVEQAVAESGI